MKLTKRRAGIPQSSSTISLPPSSPPFQTPYPPHQSIALSTSDLGQFAARFEPSPMDRTPPGEATRALEPLSQGRVGKRFSEFHSRPPISFLTNSGSWGFARLRRRFTGGGRERSEELDQLEEGASHTLGIAQGQGPIAPALSHDTLTSRTRSTAPKPSLGHPNSSSVTSLPPYLTSVVPLSDPQIFSPATSSFPAIASGYSDPPPQVSTIHMILPPMGIHLAPGGAGSPQPVTSALLRNGSSSTASSALSPSSEGSAVLLTPQHSNHITAFGRPWDQADDSHGQLYEDSPVLHEGGDDESAFDAEGGDRMKGGSKFSSGACLADRRRSSLIIELPPVSQSPTQSPTLSALAGTSTVSSVDTARGDRVLRFSTSDVANTSGLRSQALLDRGSPTVTRQQNAVYGGRRSVAFKVDAEQLPSMDGPCKRQRVSKPTQIPLIRHRSSSLDATSLATNSVYNVRELGVANTARLPAVSFQLPEYNIPNETESQGAGPAQPDMNSTTGFSSAVRSAFKSNYDGAVWSRQGIAGEWGGNGPCPHREGCEYRPAPLPPYQAPTLVSPLRPTLSRSRTAPKASKYSPKANEEPDSDIYSNRPELVQRTISLGRLRRKMSTVSTEQSKVDARQEDEPPISPHERAVTMPMSPFDLAIRDVPLSVECRTERPGILRNISSGRSIKRNKAKRTKPAKDGIPPLPSPRSTSLLASLDMMRTPPHGLTIQRDRSGSVMLGSLSDFKKGLPSEAADANPPSQAPLPEAATEAWVDILDPFAAPLVADRECARFAGYSFVGLPFLPPTAVTDNRSDRYQAHLQEARRKYRQTLVDIEDDLVFQRVLEDLARLERDIQMGGLTEEDIPLSSAVSYEMPTVLFPTITRSPSRDSAEKRASQQHIKACFVTRELVQGERRHGRLLAKGVTIIKSAAESRQYKISASPTSLDSFGTRKSRNSTRLRRSKPGPGGVLPSSPSMPSLPINVSGHVHPAPSSATPPLDLLLEKLPRLLALSLTLSLRFEHDPSPCGVAQVFIAMEADSTAEIGQWASEIGNLLAMDMGEMLDRTQSPRPPRRSSASDSCQDFGVKSDAAERLGFADIIIVPIQRAMRYKMLFQELITKTPRDSLTRLRVNEALAAAERLAAECDERQLFDLQAIRRTSGGPVHRKSKRRPQSVGPGTITRGWFGSEAV